MKNNKIGLSRKKEFYLGLILSIVLMLVLFTINASTTYINNRKETFNKIDMLTDNIESNLIRTLESIDNISKSIFLNATFQNETDGLYDTNLHEQATENISKIFEKSLNTFDSLLVKDIYYLPRNNGELDLTNHIHYGYSNTLFSKEFDEDLENIVSEALLDENSNGKLFLTELYQLGNSSNQICFSRNIYSIRTQNFKEQMGIGIVIVNKSRLIDVLNYSCVIDGLAISLSSNENVKFYSSNVDEEILTSKYSSVQTTSLGVYDWKATYYYNQSYFFITIKDSLVDLVLIMLLIIGIYVVFYYIFHKKNLKSIYYLFDNFSQISSDINLRKIQYIDDLEINHVIQAYNEMVDSVNLLNNNILYEKERTHQYQIQRKNFEIKSLNSQINKHFIVNVLSIIHSLINLKQTENANYCLENLSDFLRYSLTLDSESYIKDELNNVKSYFNIQSIRYSKVNYKINFDDSIGDIKVPKLIIQPLVENAYMHGLKNKQGNIEVLCKKEGNFIYLSVIDDGANILEEEIEELNKKIEMCEEIEIRNETSHGIALTNIQKRLNFMYGDKASLRLENVDGNKTKSIIQIELE